MRWIRACNISFELKQQLFSFGFYFQRNRTLRWDLQRRASAVMTIQADPPLNTDGLLYCFLRLTKLRSTTTPYLARKSLRHPLPVPLPLRLKCHYHRCRGRRSGGRRGHGSASSGRWCWRCWRSIRCLWCECTSSLPRTRTVGQLNSLPSVGTEADRTNKVNQSCFFFLKYKICISRNGN